MSITIIFLIAVSLSMDAFSLSLAYGTLNVDKSKRILLSIIVGAYHFFMPILGMNVGKTVFLFKYKLSKQYYIYYRLSQPQLYFLFYPSLVFK